jgi:hypothetical protein
MNLNKSFFNLVVSNRVNPSDVTYEEVTSVHLTRLTFTLTLNVTSIQPVLPQLLVYKMSHTILNGATLVVLSLIYCCNYEILIFKR